jgi:opacity protein-like surface antigen
MYFCIYRYIHFYITKIRWLVLVLGVVGVAPTASAADLEQLFSKSAPLNDPFPDSLTWHGITFYGTVDIGYAYQTNGRPLGGAVTGLEFTPFTTTRNYTGQSVSTVAHSGLEQSKVGVRFDEPLGSDWSAIGKLETGFDPTGSGSRTDATLSSRMPASPTPNKRQTRIAAVAASLSTAKPMAASVIRLTAR